MNKADWELLEKIQAGSMSDDKAYLLKNKAAALRLADKGYVLILGPGREDTPYAGKYAAVVLKSGEDALEEYKEKQKEKKRARTVQTLGIVLAIPAAVFALLNLYLSFTSTVLPALAELLQTSAK